MDYQHAVMNLMREAMEDAERYLQGRGLSEQEIKAFCS
jgi:hypothetical protein